MRKPKPADAKRSRRPADDSTYDGRPIPPKHEEMITLRCPSCGRSLYMSLRILRSPSWRCPACDTKIQPSANTASAGDAPVTLR